MNSSPQKGHIPMPIFMGGFTKRNTLSFGKQNHSKDLAAFEGAQHSSQAGERAKNAPFFQAIKASKKGSNN